VIFEERLIGSIACGPALLWDADDVAVSEFMEKTKDMNIRLDVHELFRSATSCSCTDITSAAQILFIIVNSLSREHSRYLNQRAQITEQQARINELIIDRKSAAAASLERGKRPPDPAYPVETEKEFIALVQGGNKEQANRVLNTLLGEIFSFADGNMDTIRVRLFELIASLSRSAVETGAPLSLIDGITQRAFFIFDNTLDFERICFLTSQSIDGFIDTVFKARTRKELGEHLSKAAAYITKNYAEELTLNGVADAIFVSSFYLSHLFRKELNATFSDYVCKVRIDKAKALLKGDKQIKIQEVTAMVGFNDPNYFAKSFKKLTGVTPKEYQAFFHSPAV
jgi:two-component system response regulator YesN